MVKGNETLSRSFWQSCHSTPPLIGLRLCPVMVLANQKPWNFQGQNCQEKWNFKPQLLTKLISWYKQRKPSAGTKPFEGKSDDAIYWHRLTRGGRRVIKSLIFDDRGLCGVWNGSENADIILALGFSILGLFFLSIGDISSVAPCSRPLALLVCRENDQISVHIF